MCCFIAELQELQDLSDLSGLTLKPEVLEIVSASSPPPSRTAATHKRSNFKKALVDPSRCCGVALWQLWEMNQLNITPTALSDMLKAVKAEKIKQTLS